MKTLNKIISAISAGVLTGGIAFAAFAETTPPPVNTRNIRSIEAQNLKEEQRANAQQIKEGVRAQAQQVRDEAKQRVEGVRMNIQEKVGERKEEIRTKILEQREEAKKRLEAVRTEAKQRLETAREEFRKKLEQIRDERKKQIATRLDEQMNRLNERWTTHFANVLDHLENILAKTEVRANKALSLGKDISAVQEALKAAKNAIASARLAVEAQAHKVYVVSSFESESELGGAFRKAKEQLKADLNGLRDGVMRNAREAVQKAFNALSQIQGVNDEPEAEGAGGTEQQ